MPILFLIEVMRHRWMRKLFVEHQLRLRGLSQRRAVFVSSRWVEARADSKSPTLFAGHRAHQSVKTNVRSFDPLHARARVKSKPIATAMLSD
jgi:hypothetical protein